MRLITPIELLRKKEQSFKCIPFQQVIAAKTCVERRYSGSERWKKCPECLHGAKVEEGIQKGVAASEQKQLWELAEASRHYVMEDKNAGLRAADREERPFYLHAEGMKLKRYVKPVEELCLSALQAGWEVVRETPNSGYSGRTRRTRKILPRDPQFYANPRVQKSGAEEKFVIGPFRVTDIKTKKTVYHRGMAWDEVLFALRQPKPSNQRLNEEAYATYESEVQRLVDEARALHLPVVLSIGQTPLQSPEVTADGVVYYLGPSSLRRGSPPRKIPYKPLPLRSLLAMLNIDPLYTWMNQSKYEAVVARYWELAKKTETTSEEKTQLAQLREFVSAHAKKKSDKVLAAFRENPNDFDEPYPTTFRDFMKRRGEKGRNATERRKIELLKAWNDAREERSAKRAHSRKFHYIERACWERGQWVCRPPATEEELKVAHAKAVQDEEDIKQEHLKAGTWGGRRQ